jgi:hypothetical protein
VIDYLLYLYYSLNLYLFFNYSLNNLNFKDLFNNFDYSFYYMWNLDNFLYYSFNRHNFLDNISYDHWNFKWNMYNSFNLSYFFHFNYLFYYFLDCNDLWNLYNSIHNFLYNFLNLDYLWDNSEYFKDVININYSHNLLINHSNYTFINL